jgi:TrmH family RNA methyltransferase
VSDPGNTGSILRSAEAAGALAVMTVPGTVELHNPKVIRASMGSIFRVPSFEGIPPEPLCDELRGLGYRIIALRTSGGMPYTEIDFPGRSAIVLGNEAWGLSDGFLKGSDISVSIPLQGNAESLNVSAACAVILFKYAEVRSDGIG